MVLAEQAPAMRDAVIAGFAFNSDDPARVSSPGTLDAVVRNSLAIQLRDRELASDVYDDVREQVIRAKERWHDVDVSVALSHWDSSPGGARTAPLFVATVRWEYTVVPRSPTMRFGCVSDMAEYRELLLDPSMTGAWYFGPTGELDEGLTRGVPAGATERERRGAADPAHGPQGVAGLQRDAGQGGGGDGAGNGLLHLPHVGQAARSPALPRHCPADQGAQSGAAVRRLRGPLRQRARLHRQRTVHPRVADSGLCAEPVVAVGFDGWVFPRSGVAFVWVLDSEMIDGSRPSRARPATSASK